MKRVHILGCGHFGRRALTVYGGRQPKTDLVLVDADEHELESAAGLAKEKGILFQTVREDATVYLAALLGADENSEDDWIIPSAPLHLAFAALCRVTGRSTLPWPFPPRLPNLFASDRHEFCSSIADFICPEDCPQPRKYCFHTGKPRSPSLLKQLATLHYELEGRALPSLILPSTQLAPGVGGFPCRRLVRLVACIQERYPGPLIFSTACRCHGISNILSGC
ncbi:MAG: hypothetical protein GXO34_04780 [Deltaproteobacteria bacterium]|nr:hypothetical protein [Deltaproteobacteria bacterium]